MIIARILQASAPGGGSGKTIACRLSLSKSAKSAAKNFFRSGFAVSPIGCAAVPVIQRNRQEAQRIDDDQRRATAIVLKTIFESCP
jgi:hypothetical protein